MHILALFFDLATSNDLTFYCLGYVYRVNPFIVSITMFLSTASILHLNRMLSQKNFRHWPWKGFFLFLEGTTPQCLFDWCQHLIRLWMTSILKGKWRLATVSIYLSFAILIFLAIRLHQCYLMVVSWGKRSTFKTGF